VRKKEICATDNEKCKAQNEKQQFKIQKIVFSFALLFCTFRFALYVF